MNKFFGFENAPFPPSLTYLGQQRQGTKSDLLSCLDNCAPSSRDSPPVDVKILDGAAIVHMLKPGGNRTFEDYAQNVFLPHIKKELDKVERLDVIWDRYLPDSLKQSTREKRMNLGTIQRQRVLPTAPIPTSWENFLRGEDNKNELFHNLSDSMKSYNTYGKILVSTYDESVITSDQTMMDLNSLQPCSHEEADTRIFLHAAHCAQQGFKRIAIRTVDTDVVVLAVAHFHSLNIEELWINFGVGKHYRNIPAHEIASSLGDEKAKALLMFHALTGCDTVSSFYGKGKKTAWSTWMAYPTITHEFVSLLSQPIEITPEVLHKVERFVILMYSRTCTLSKVNEARKDLFARSGRTIDNIPPTQAALIQHLNRSVYQASYIWAQALVPSPNLPSPGDWGYKKSPTGWTPHWSDLPDAAKACQELVHCGCKKGCSPQCKCRKVNLECTELCWCKGECNDE